MPKAPKKLTQAQKLKLKQAAEMKRARQRIELHTKSQRDRLERVEDVIHDPGFAGSIVDHDLENTPMYSMNFMDELDVAIDKRNKLKSSQTKHKKSLFNSRNRKPPKRRKTGKQAWVSGKQRVVWVGSRGGTFVNVNNRRVYVT